MKSYVRQAGSTRNAYKSELKRALQEGYTAGMAHALFCLHLTYGFGAKRLGAVAETANDLAGSKKGRCTNVKVEMDFLKDKYNIDVWKIQPRFEVEHETTAQRDERIKKEC